MKSALYFADDQVRHAFFMLQSGRSEEKEIFNQLNTAFDTITMDPFCGIQVPKRLIPKVYITKYGIQAGSKLKKESVVYKPLKQISAI